MTAATLPIPSPEAGLTAYLNQIKRFPLLAPEQEYSLAKRFHDHDDIGAAHELVTSHLRLVAKIAMGYRRYGLPMADVIAEGNLGLMKAVKKFEPEKGFRLSTYAMWWVKASINEYILNSWSLVKIGTVSTQKRIFYNLRKMKAQLGSYDEGGLTDEHATQIADTLQVKKADVHAMNARLQSRDRSLNAPVGEEGNAERVDLLPDTAPNQEEMLEARQTRDRSRVLVHTALQVLNERERHIITQRRLIDDPVTLETLGEEYGLSRERVRQIEARALQKLEARIRDIVKEEKRGVHAAISDHAAGQGNALPAAEREAA
ncbi:MAG: RNA polymerase sigma factor RpoH [Rhodospirillaceae bacterium]